MNTMRDISIIECPRDAMQGWPTIIPTSRKVAYINQLLKVGFDTIDFASFVSHSLIPQMADSAQVADAVEVQPKDAGLLAIVLNRRGAEDAMKHQRIQYLGFPLSVSETFQKRNANSTIRKSTDDLKYIAALCAAHNKEVVVYLSMAFGNPYGDPYNQNIVAEAAETVAAMGIHTISLADTVGIATASEVELLVGEMVQLFPDNEIGVHLHSTADNWRDKLAAAYDSGCYRFDGAINGYGGCPMAEDALVGNMNTGLMVRFFKEKGLLAHIDMEALEVAEQMAASIFI